eukprot:gene37351-55204_t
MGEAQCAAAAGVWCPFGGRELDKECGWPLTHSCAADINCYVTSWADPCSHAAPSAADDIATPGRTACSATGGAYCDRRNHWCAGKAGCWMKGKMCYNPALDDPCTIDEGTVGGEHQCGLGMVWCGTAPDAWPPVPPGSFAGPFSPMKWKDYDLDKVRVQEEIYAGELGAKAVQLVQAESAFVDTAVEQGALEMTVFGRTIQAPL